MLKDKKAIDPLFTDIFIKIAGKNSDIYEKITEYCNKHFNFPPFIILDFAQMHKSIYEANDFLIFVLMSCFINMGYLDNILDQFFTKNEIEYYSNEKYKEDKIEFPLIFNVIQIAEDQWIGKITVKDLMKLRKAQMINYNANGQRALKKVVRNEVVTYKISLNRTAVNEIEELYEKDRFIPNTITFSIPDNSNSLFYYDENNCKLIINSIDHFDISDGYHRYMALCKVVDKNPDFDYNMEIRITNFSIDKIKQFIFQEDQKNKMKYSNANYYNIYNSANTIVKRVNESQRSNLQGLIKLNGTVIDAGLMSDIIDKLYFSNKNEQKDQNDRAIQITISNKLIDFFNVITEHDMKLLKKINVYTLYILIAIFYIYYEKNNDDAEVVNIYDLAIDNIKDLDTSVFSKNVRTKTKINRALDFINKLKIKEG